MSMTEFLYFFTLKKYGLEALADMHATQLMLALEHHKKHKRVYQLGLFVGVYEPGKISKLQVGAVVQ